MDPVSAIAAATAAFNVIKKGFEIGRDVESMYGDIGRWMSATSDILQAEKMAKKPPLFKKIVFAGSVEKEALEAFAAFGSASFITATRRMASHTSVLLHHLCFGRRHIFS